MTPNIKRMIQELREPLQKNAIYLMASNVVSSLFGFFFWIVAARLYPTRETGLATAIISAIMLLVTISKLGFDFSLIRFLPHADNRRDMINTCLTTAGLVALAAGAAFIAGLDIWSPKLLFIRENWMYQASLIAFTIVLTITQLQGQVFIAFRSARFTLIQSIINGLRLPMVTILAGLAVLGIFSSVGLAAAVSLVTGIFFVLKLSPGYRPVPVIKKQVARDLAQFSLGNYGAALLGALPGYLMPLIIISVLNPEASAYFYIPYSISSILGVVAASTTLSLLAESSHDPAGMRTQVIKAIRLIMLIVVPGIVILFVFGGRILSWFGADYTENATRLLWLFGLSWLPNIVNMLYLTITRLQLRIKPIILTDGALAALTIGIAYALMKQVGLIGVGVAFLAGQGIVALVVTPRVLKMAGISAKSLFGRESWNLIRRSII